MSAKIDGRIVLARVLPMLHRPADITAPIDLHATEGGGGTGKEIPDELLLSLCARDGLQKAMTGSNVPATNLSHTSPEKKTANQDPSLLFILRQRQESLPPSSQDPQPNHSPDSHDQDWYNEHGQDRPK